MTAMTRRGLLALAIIALLAGHVFVLHRLSSRLALPIEVALGVLALVVLAHLGVFRKVAALLRRPPK